MEEPTNDPKSQSEKIMPTIRDPATQGKKALGFSPNIHERNIKSKKFKTQKSILKKERAIMETSKQEKGVGIIWDNKAIDEQKSYRTKHRLSTMQRHKMKSLSRTKYNSAVIGIEDDEYLKNLIKVNQITLTDELIKNITNLLNEPKECKKVRNNSTHIKIPNTFDLNSKAIRDAAENMHVFDGVLDDESKITLQNTIINKFHKEVLG